MTPRSSKLLPPEIARQAAQEHNLGDLAATYRSSLDTAVVSVVAGAVSLAVAVFTIVNLSGRRISSDDFLAFAGFLLLGIVCEVAWLILRRHWVVHVFVFENGLVRVHDGVGDVCRWDEIAVVRYSTEEDEHGLGKSKTYALQLRDGRAIELSDLTKFRQLAQLIRQRTRERLLAEAEQEFQNGRSIDFGPRITVDREGVTLPKDTLAWGEIKAITPPDKQGIIYLQRRESWFRVKAGHVRQIPNYFVFVDLVQRLLGNTDMPPERLVRERTFFGFLLKCFFLASIGLALIILVLFVVVWLRG
jgi:hypothetical protein